MDDARSCARGIPCGKSTSMSQNGSYGSEYEQDFEFEFGSASLSSVTSPTDASCRPGSRGQLGSNMRSQHSSLYFLLAPSSHPTNWQIQESGQCQAPSSILTHTNGTGRITGFDIEISQMTSDQSSPTSCGILPSNLSLLTSQIDQQLCSSLPREEQQAMASPIPIVEAHARVSSIDTSPGFSMTSQSSYHDESLSLLLDHHITTLTSSPILTGVGQYQSDKTHPIVMIDDLDRGLYGMSPNPTQITPGLLDGLDMLNTSNDVSSLSSTELVAPSSSNQSISSLSSGHIYLPIKSRKSLRAPSISVTVPHHTHPYHRPTGFSSSTSSLSPYEPTMLLSTLPTSPLSPLGSLSNSHALFSALSPQGDDASIFSIIGTTLDDGRLYGQFTQSQQPAARVIFKYMMDHPNAVIPTTYITSTLADIKDGRGRCLIGACVADAKSKRADHLYDHIRDKHFGSRPYVCSFCNYSFSREYDLKRHSHIHEGKLLECSQCSKAYTRFDNLQRHMLQKHGQFTSQSLPSTLFP